jgi:urease accessory protein
MLRLDAILGQRDDPRFAGREVDELPVTWAEAGRRRLRRTTVSGDDAAIDVPRGSFLRDGAVLADDGERIVVVARTPEPALLIRLSDGLCGDERVRIAALVGHAFGNQHVPIDVEGSELRVPLTTSEVVARATIEALGLTGLSVSVESLALGCHAAMRGSAHHHAPYDHTDDH